MLGGNRTVATVFVIPDDLSLGIDAYGIGIYGSGNIENGVRAAAVNETLILAAIILSVRFVLARRFVLSC